MDKKITMGVSAPMIVTLVFSVLGGIYVLLGGVLIFAGHSVMLIVGSVFALLGTVFLCVGALLFFLECRKRKRARAMVAAGRYIWAEVVDVVPNRNVRVNGRYCCNIVARYVDGRGYSHIFRSPNLPRYCDPGFLGKQVKIYYEDASFQHYYMDLENVLATCMEH